MKGFVGSLLLFIVCYSAGKWLLGGRPDCPHDGCRGNMVIHYSDGRNIALFYTYENGLQKFLKAGELDGKGGITSLGDAKYWSRVFYGLTSAEPVLFPGTKLM